MAEPETQLLSSSARSIGISLSDMQLDQLIAYVDLLEKWNRTYNLTSIRDRQEILLRHVVESLAVLPLLQGSNRLDVGTGAGIPGIPLAIADRELRYTLVDSNGKKTRFLAEVKRQLGLTNIQIETVRIESWQPKTVYDAVLTRAFADVKTTLTRISHVLSKEGSLYAMTTDSVAKVDAAIPDNMYLHQAKEIKVPGQDWSFNVMIIGQSQGALV
jgi:16S rRNA (guanine527-N7)-methyltransferase